MASGYRPSSAYGRRISGSTSQASATPQRTQRLMTDDLGFGTSEENTHTMAAHMPPPGQRQQAQAQPQQYAGAGRPLPPQQQPHLVMRPGQPTAQPMRMPQQRPTPQMRPQQPMRPPPPPPPQQQRQAQMKNPISQLPVKVGDAGVTVEATSYEPTQTSVQFHAAVQALGERVTAIQTAVEAARQTHTANEKHAQTTLEQLNKSITDLAGRLNEVEQSQHAVYGLTKVPVQLYESLPPTAPKGEVPANTVLSLRYPQKRLGFNGNDMHSVGPGDIWMRTVIVNPKTATPTKYWIKLFDGTTNTLRVDNFGSVPPTPTTETTTAIADTEGATEGAAEA